MCLFCLLFLAALWWLCDWRPAPNVVSFRRCPKDYTWICIFVQKESFIFLKKKKKKKSEGYTYDHTAHCLARNILLWWISPHFVTFVNFGWGTRKITRIQRKSLKPHHCGVSQGHQRFVERTAFYLLCFLIEPPWTQWLSPIISCDWHVTMRYNGKFVSGMQLSHYLSRFVLPTCKWCT